MHYYLALTLLLPLLPILYIQAIVIRRKIPDLPEAKGKKGVIRSGSKHGNGLSILFLGESTIAGIGVKDHKEGIAGSLAKELSIFYNADMHWTVVAKSGYTARKVKELIVPSIPRNTYDLIVIGLGANDAFSLNRPLKWDKHIADLVSTLQQRFHGIPIIFLNMPPIREFHALTYLLRYILGNYIEMLGRRLEILTSKIENVYYLHEVISLKSWKKKFSYSEKTESFFSDGIHPSSTTYKLWGKELFSFINSHSELSHYLHQRLHRKKPF